MLASLLLSIALINPMSGKPVVVFLTTVGMAGSVFLPVMQIPCSVFVKSKQILLIRNHVTSLFVPLMNQEVQTGFLAKESMISILQLQVSVHQNNAGLMENVKIPLPLRDVLSQEKRMIKKTSSATMELGKQILLLLSSLF